MFPIHKQSTKTKTKTVLNSRGCFDLALATKMAESSNDSVQVVDEAKVFQKNDFNKYVKEVIRKDLGVNYHVISVFGSQSTGKSTLLNKLFHTNFDVMNESQRQQTTKGIWLGFSPRIEASSGDGKEENILVMDVEGSDGRERGEDQDFERKAALFALSTSEILIVNIWEHQVGLYQGANMGLLKTVFEVNLSLFGDKKDHKVLLLFVIRDHVGSTPLSNLSNTLTQDLNKMWDSISKPNTVKEDVKLSDYFDLEFTGLAHKVLQPEKFDQDVRNLGDRFISTSDADHLFKKDYKQNFPIDGWTLYAENCWEQIQSNKDLDLPTQQILVARFRCDEIVKESIELFKSESGEILKGLNLRETEGSQLASYFKTLRNLAFTSYDSQASHYNKAVYESKRLSLANEVNQDFQKIYQDYVKDLTKSSLEIFNSTFLDKNNKSQSFLEKSTEARDKAINKFKDNLTPFTELDPETFDFTAEFEELSVDLDNELSKARENEINGLVNKTIKKTTPAVKNQVFELFTTPNEKLWDKVLETFRSILASSLAKYQVSETLFDFKLGTSEEESFEIASRIQRSVWISFDQIIHDYFNEDNVVNILRREFEEKFAYDSRNVPRIWKNEADISQVYKYATEQALSTLPILSLAKLSNGSEIIPDFTILEDEDDDDEEPHRFAHILTATQQAKIKKQFLKLAEISYRDANRSIITNVAKIPPFIYILLIVLGWNEFMAILRNPLYLVLTILIGTGLFFVHTLNLWGPLQTASNVFAQQGKGYLASLLLDDGQSKSSTPILAQPVKGDSYELDDLSEKKEN